jgi:hypothetical protein
MEYAIVCLKSSGVDSMGESEVTRLRYLIELECEAMERGLTGYAATARHEIVSHKYMQLAMYREQLEQLIGKTQSTKTLVEIYRRTVG